MSFRFFQMEYHLEYQSGDKLLPVGISSWGQMPTLRICSSVRIYCLRHRSRIRDVRLSGKLLVSTMRFSWEKRDSVQYAARVDLLGGG